MREENVGIVGAGALGAAIAGHFARRGIGCAICNSREAASLQHIVESLGGRLRAVTLQEAVAPEIVILAIPRARVPEMMEHVSDWEGRILIDATNPSTSREDDAAWREQLVVLAPGAHVVVAFNTLPAAVLAGPPAEAGGRRVIFYCGDHVRAKRKVGALIAGLGFAAIDLGPLTPGSRLQRSPDGALAMLDLIQLSGVAPARS